MQFVPGEIADAHEDELNVKEAYVIDEDEFASITEGDVQFDIHGIPMVDGHRLTVIQLVTDKKTGEAVFITNAELELSSLVYDMWYVMQDLKEEMGGFFEWGEEYDYFAARMIEMGIDPDLWKQIEMEKEDERRNASR